MYSLGKSKRHCVNACFLADDISPSRLRDEVTLDLSYGERFLESKDFRLSMGIMDYMEGKFNKRHDNNVLVLKIGNHNLPIVVLFRYLISILQHMGIDGDVTYRTCWMDEMKECFKGNLLVQSTHQTQGNFLLDCYKISDALWL